MKLYCTEDLQERLGITLAVGPEPTDPLDCWCAHVASIQGTDVVSVSLTSVRFTVLIWGIRRGHWDSLDARIVQRIREVLAAYQIPLEIIDRYLPEGTVLEKCAAPAGMDPFHTDLEDEDHFLDWGIHWEEEEEEKDDHSDFQDLQNDANISDMEPETDALIRDWRTPAANLTALLHQRYGGPIPALELDLTLDMQRYLARRTAVVPASATFWQLHCALQAACRWTNSAMHLFTLPPKGDRQHPLLLSDASALSILTDPDTPSTVEDTARLQDYLQPGDTFSYLYDTRSCWRCTVQVTHSLMVPSAELPFCTACAGIIPSDDLCGVEGALTMQDILANPCHPAYHEFRPLSRRDWFLEDSIEEITQRLHTDALAWQL